MKRAASLAILSLIAACGGGGEGSMSGGIPGYGNVVSTAQAGTVPKNCSIAIYGDSIASGTNGSGRLAHPPADRIREWRPAYYVYDGAVPGQTITEHIAQFEATPINTRFVVVEWAVNDVNRGLDFEEPLRRAVRHAKAGGAVVIQTGLYWVSADPSKQAIPQRISQQEATGYAWWETLVGPTIAGPVLDGHPTQEFSDVLWNRVVEIMDAVAPECGPRGY